MRRARPGGPPWDHPTRRTCVSSYAGGLTTNDAPDLRKRTNRTGSPRNLVGRREPAVWVRASAMVSVRLGPMVGFLLSVTFAWGVVIAVSHVINHRCVAPVYDVVANLTAFACAVAASLLLHHWIPALLSAMAILCWLVLARRPALAGRAAPAAGTSRHQADARPPTQDLYKDA